MQAPGFTDSPLHYSVLWTSALDSASGWWAMVPESRSTQPEKEEAAPTSFCLSHLLSLCLSRARNTPPASHPAHFPSCFMRQIGHKLLPKPIWGKQAPVNHSGPPLELGWGQFSIGTCLQGGEEGTLTKSGIC